MSMEGWTYWGTTVSELESNLLERGYRSEREFDLSNQISILYILRTTFQPETFREIYTQTPPRQSA